MGTRSSTQARSHAQKFFVKLEKKNLTMESFLENLDIHNLRTFIDNDSDYGDETDQVSQKSHKAAAGNFSLSVESVQHSQSAMSNIKLAKGK